MADFINNKIQKNIFEYIKNSTKNKINLVNEISNLLNISTDAAYRRIRGDKQLSLSELVKISQCYSLSIDSIINANFNDIRFSYIPLLDDFNENYLTYINQLKNQMSDIARQKKKKLYFAAGDIPIFHLCKYPNLISFKSYTWLQQLGNSLIKYNKNNFINEKHIELYDEIYSLYKNIDSYEIWTIQTIDSYLKLINYYAEIDYFENMDDGIELCNDLLSLVKDIRMIGEVEYSTNPSKECKNQLFLSEVNLDNKFVYVETNSYKITFINLFSLNTIKTTHEVFCDGTARWFKSMISKSMLISGSSQKQFLMFINELNNRIDHTKKKLTSQN